MSKWIVTALITMLTALAVVAWAAPQDGVPRAVPRGGGGPGGPAGRPDMRPGPGPAPGFGAWLRNPEALRKAGLTEDQVAKVRDLTYRSAKESIRLRSELEIAELELRELLAGDGVDEAAAMAAVEQVGQKELELTKARVRDELRLRAIVGPDKLRELRAERRDDLRERVGERRGDDEPRRGPARDPRGERRRL